MRLFPSYHTTNKTMQCQLAVVVLVCVGVRWSKAELFTAISDMEPLLETQKRIIDDLQRFIREDEERLRYIKQTVDHYKEEHERAMTDIPNYLGNPINAFTLIKRLTLDIDNMEKMIQKGAEMSKNTTIARKIGQYPTHEDLSGAAEALMRLQDTYQLDVHELAQGKLNGVQYSNPLSSSDCFELGRGLYNAKDYSSSQLWMMESLRKYEAHDTDRVLKSDILEYLAFSNYLLGDVIEALHWTEELVKEMPNHPRAVGNIPHYRKQIQELEQQKKNQEEETSSEESDEDTEGSGEAGKARQTERGIYEALCRGEMDIPAHIAKRLKCFYQSKNDPFLKLAPFKVEQMYLNPDVYVFHEVMSDDEIEYIQDMARPRFKRATVHNPQTGELVPAQYRISKSSWLKDEESHLVQTVSRRVTHMTGLSMVSAEELQVVNYGIGGHYEPHFDFARNDEKHAFENQMGNRIATVLFYMSDVAQGGATVFTELGLTVFPRRGTALYWLNLHPSGEGNFATRHAACPVLRGSKWVSNKWIHQSGQELIKPCNLEYQSEGLLRPIPKPVFKTNR